MAMKSIYLDGPFGVIQKLLASILCIALFSVTTGSTSFSQVPGLAGSVAGNAAALGGLAVGIHGLVNDAISQANNDLADRLKQLEQIVNGALFSLTTAMNYGIDKMDFTMQSNLRVANEDASQLLSKFGALANTTLEQAQGYLSDDIDNIGNKFGNAIAQVDILNTTPVLNIPKNGIAVFRGHGDTTKIYLSGVGLEKESTSPEVKLIGQDGSSVPVNLLTSTMAFMTLSIPTSNLSKFGNYTLSFKFCTGTFLGFRQYGEQKAEVLACSIPRITISARLWIEGDSWITRARQVNEGNLAGGTIYGVQISGGNGNQPRDINVQAAPGWELYDTQGWGRVINCARNSENGHTDITYTGPTSCRIYVDGSSGDAHLNVMVFVGERQRVHKNQCGDEFSKSVDLIGIVKTTLDFAADKLKGDCDSGIVLKDVFKSNHGDALTDHQGLLADRQVSVDVGDGIISLVSTPRCVEQAYGRAEVH